MNEKEQEHHLSEKHHMKILWEEFFKSDGDTLVQDATLVEKASIVGRVGIMLLSCGTGAWRVRDSMDTIARTLGITQRILVWYRLNILALTLIMNHTRKPCLCQLLV